MKYKNVSDKEYKGFDLTIYEMERGDYIVDVKKPRGELIAGWEHKKTFNCAMMTGVNYIEEMVSRGVAA